MCLNHTSQIRPEGGRVSGRLQVVECRSHAPRAGQPTARGGGSAHKAPILLATALSPGNGEPCPDFLRRLPVLCRTLLLPKPLCPLLPDHLRLHKRLKRHGLGALRSAVLDHPAHGQPADPRALLLPLPSVPRTGRARAVTPPGSGVGRGEALDPHPPRSPVSMRDWTCLPRAVGGLPVGCWVRTLPGWHVGWSVCLTCVCTVGPHEATCRPHSATAPG